ncbi:peptidase [Synechococcus sp. CS-1329]|jgi:hypothetical protein|uniref:peptidase n=1 Tax=Synechococcus sp. CS-1329 TaxID=2847975 RepID=UPI00223BC32F|nr:peptidase [Synechococcus sp. CS-1329]MCT0219220.1 peptidase [Synechococcus sp. CS-1329]
MQLLARLRRWHALIGPLVVLPLLITVCSGMGYRLLRDWGGLSRDQVHGLMVLHEGEWLGPVGETIYVALNGLGLLWMLVTGTGLALQSWSRQRRRPEPKEGAGEGGT